MLKKILIGTVFILVVCGWWLLPDAPIKPGDLQNYNVVLITLDTTRADRLPVYGYDRIKTPNIDRLAGKSYVFDDAISHVPLTLPAHASILTGLLPFEHGIRNNAGSILPQQIQTLPEILKENGYATGAFVSAFVLDSRWQLDQGFDFYSDHFDFGEPELSTEHVQRRAEPTARQASSWIQAQASKPFFAWIHFYDPHEPYNAPKPFNNTYAPYDAEIAYMDSGVGTVLDTISSAGITEKTLIIVTADHGEGLGEHQEDTHGTFLYETTQRRSATYSRARFELSEANSIARFARGHSSDSY